MDPEIRKNIVCHLKTKMRKDNWKYLSNHPEIRAFVRVVLYETMKKQPAEPYNFIANLFDCDNITNISEKVNEQMRRLKNLQCDCSWNEYDGHEPFNIPNDSESSLNSARSLLKFSGIGEEEKMNDNDE